MGVIFIGISQNWFWAALPMDWAGISNPYAGVAAISYYWVTSLFALSIFIALWGLLVYKIKTANLINLFLFPSLWVLLEYLRAWGYTLFYWSESSLLGPHWTPALLGYALANNTFLLQLARFGGGYLLSFFVVLVGFLVYLFILDFKNVKLKTKFLIFAALIFIFVFLDIYISNSSFRHGDQSIRFALVNTQFKSHFNYTLDEQLDEFERQKEIITQIKDDGLDPDVIVLPEGSNFLRRFNLNQESSAQEYLSNILGGTDKLIIDSGPVIKQNRDAYSTIFYFDLANGQYRQYQKQLLYPNGEYLPYLVTWPAKIFGQSKFVENFNKYRAYKKGGETKVVNYNDVNIGGNFCSEISSGNLYRDFVNQGAQVLVNVASHSVFKGDHMLSKQLIDMAKVRAVEVNRFLIRPNNWEGSFVVDSLGRIVSQASIGNPKVIYADITPLQNKTAFVRFGNWIVGLSAMIIGLIFFHNLILGRKRKNVV